jgi:hypothetical protein
VRSLGAQVIAELEADVCRPAFLFSAFFEEQELNLWTGYGPLIVGSKTYLGNGYLVGVSLPMETEDTRAEGIRVELTGVPQETLSLILNQSQHGDPCTLSLVTMGEDGQVIGSPYPIFSGFLDIPEIVDDEGTASLVLSYESRLIALEKASGHRYTYEGQRAFYPSDEGFAYVVSLQDWTGFWGRPRITGA